MPDVKFSYKKENYQVWEVLNYDDEGQEVVDWCYTNFAQFGDERPIWNYKVLHFINRIHIKIYDDNANMFFKLSWSQ